MLSQQEISRLSVEEALRRLAAEPELLCLDGGRGGWSYVALPANCRRVASLAQLPRPAQGRAVLSQPGWPGQLDGGWVVQLDYGFPVGPHAAAVASAGERGRAGQLCAWLSWDPAGRCQLHGGGAAREALAAALAQAPAALPAPTVLSPPRPLWDAAAHQDKVSQVRAAIAAGECFQANVAVPFDARVGPGQAVDLALFLALRRESPAPYAFFWRQASDDAGPGRSICSHSPECFLQGDGQELRSEPIKGTRRRRPGSETALRAELLASPKDRAELAMIVDLVRNDLGRIAKPGTVRVAAAALIMDLDYVHHLVARVCAQPHSGSGPAQWLAAAFPAGSITGAPKIQVMKLLQRLEGQPRGPYCGTFGWLGAGACALAVAIRSMVIQGQDVRFHAGGGIVADSDPAAEWHEVLAKARRLAEVLGQAPEVG